LRQTGEVNPDPLDSVPGWFLNDDKTLFRWFLAEQNRLDQVGDLAELGVFMGKSAILIGDYVQAGETFTVVDLFEDPAAAEANQMENDENYLNLSQRAFEGNYLRFHDQLPTVVRGLSTVVTDHAPHGSHRWVHVDASHLYEHVRQDLASSRTLLNDQGVLVCDDIRSEHTPGVAAAVWEAVVNDGLNPLVISQSKAYCTWSDPDPWQERLAAWLPTSGFSWERQEVAGNLLFRVWVQRPPDRRRVARELTPPLLWSFAQRVKARVKN